MRLVQLALIVPLLLGPGFALARPWKGITPGTSVGADVEKKFGEPTTRTKRGPRLILAYYGDQAPEGAKQAQFHVDASGVVQEITVFLAAPLDADTIEGTYGKATQKTFVEDTFQKVWVFASQGVAVYWAKDGGGVEALSFTPGKASARSDAGKSDAARPDPGKQDAAKDGARAEPAAKPAGKGT